MISDDPYRASTQYRLFSYPSPQDLLTQRTKTNGQSLSQLPTDSTYLSVTEEVELVDYYVDRLWDLCRLFQVPSHVRVSSTLSILLLIQATATSFLLRYYLHNTPLTTHPKHLILTALFLAAKTENAFIPIDYFRKQLPASVDSSQLTSLEFPLSSGLQFSYTVWSCLRPLWGFGLEIMELLNGGALNLEKDDERKVMDDARQWALESLRTDAQFLYTPPQIALACIFHFNQELVRRFLSIKFPPGCVLSPTMKTTPRNSTIETAQNGMQEDAAHKLMATVVECDRLISDRLAVVKERSRGYVTSIDKKLWQCKKLLDSLESSSPSTPDTAKRKAHSPDSRDVKKTKSE
jgi:cyclin H